MLNGISHGFEQYDFVKGPEVPEVVRNVNVRNAILRLRWAKVITESGALALLAEIK